DESGVKVACLGLTVWIGINPTRDPDHIARRFGQRTFNRRCQDSHPVCWLNDLRYAQNAIEHRCTKPVEKTPFDRTASQIDLTIDREPGGVKIAETETSHRRDPGADGPVDFNWIELEFRRQAHGHVRRNKGKSFAAR